ncbi:polysaccharide biosynthesis/export family protein [Cochlodiniinecator piscidefendens]|uniref:polysaccharide biosynthesis/export family protein n=1 Tax=Cochlodiniinecator piscidefendens TaxID=2715756 RepID=UPI001407A1FB|nr:polysaccharide biosynthesis/export family protein [Cochlodiniinecator piscidefendens]
MKHLWIVAILGLSACGTAYISPSVSERTDGAKVRVVPLTSESVLIANQSQYSPQDLPDAFFQSANTGSLRGSGALPEPALVSQTRPGQIETHLPPIPPNTPYEVGVGDVIVLATRQGASTVEELTGLLSAQNRRQGYTVQDDGAIAIPDVGRVQLSGLTIEEAEAEVFQRLIENQIDPSFSLEVSEFHSQRVAIGGAVNDPVIAPITLTPLYLNEAIALAGGVDAPDRDYVTIRLYRNGTLYQLPLSALAENRIRLLGGDSLFIDTDYELDQAQAYFEEQITLAEFRQNARIQSLNELNTAVALQRAALNEERNNFQARLSLDAIERDYVYIAGEARSQGRFALPFEQRATVADALYDEGGLAEDSGNPSEIYILRASPAPQDFGAVTAWHLDARDATNFLLATRMELRPNDVIFIAEQPITRWSRFIGQLGPTLIAAAVATTE